MIRFIRDEENEIAEELGTLIAEEKNPLPIILKGMVYKNTNITLCKLFKLYTKGCSLDKNYAEELPLSNCCEKCIEEFLEQYFMEQGREC